MKTCAGHCWVAVWIDGEYVNKCINCEEVKR